MNAWLHSSLKAVHATDGVSRQPNSHILQRRAATLVSTDQQGTSPARPLQAWVGSCPPDGGAVQLVQAG